MWRIVGIYNIAVIVIITTVFLLVLTAVFENSLKKKYLWLMLWIFTFKTKVDSVDHLVLTGIMKSLTLLYCSNLQKSLNLPSYFVLCWLHSIFRLSSMKDSPGAPGTANGCCKFLNNYPKISQHLDITWDLQYIPELLPFGDILNDAMSQLLHVKRKHFPRPQ